MIELTDQQLEEFADVIVAKGLQPWLHVTTKEQQAQALAECAATDSFNFGGGMETPEEGIAASARLVEVIASKIGVNLDAEIDTETIPR